jgi:hypothetical protein
VQAWFGESEFRRQRIDSQGNRHVRVHGYPSFGIGLRVPLTTPKKQR